MFPIYVSPRIKGSQSCNNYNDAGCYGILLISSAFLCCLRHVLDIWFTESLDGGAEWTSSIIIPHEHDYWNRYPMVIIIVITIQTSK